MNTMSNFFPVFGEQKLFQGVNLAEFNRVISLASSIYFVGGQVVCGLGDQGKSMYLVVGGNLIVTSANGEAVNHLSAGGYFGELSLLEPGPRAATVTAVTDCHLLEITTSDFERNISSLPTFVANLARGITSLFRSEAQRAGTSGRLLGDVDPDQVVPEEDIDEIASIQRFLGKSEVPEDLGKLGIYRLTAVLGIGGMGVVFAGIDTHLQRPVAIKVMKPRLIHEQQSRQRFIQEARLMAALRHPHVVAVFHVGQENHLPYLAMEWLEGETLDQRLIREIRLPVSAASRLGLQLAQGLAAAHDLGMIHRDIKPANIFIEKPDDRVKILDFGLARNLDQQTGITNTGMLVGSPGYLAPEQGGDLKLDHRCDLFSLGCVLYKLLTGIAPFERPTILATLSALASETPLQPTKLNPEIPAELSALIVELMAKNRDERPASAHHAIERLQPFSVALAGTTLSTM